MLVWIRSRIPAYIRHLATYDVLLIERTDKETYFRDVKAVIDRVSYTYTALILLHLHNIVCISIGVYTCTLKYTYINVCIQKIKQNRLIVSVGSGSPVRLVTAANRQSPRAGDGARGGLRRSRRTGRQGSGHLRERVSGALQFILPAPFVFQLQRSVAVLLLVLVFSICVCMYV